MQRSILASLILTPLLFTCAGARPRLVSAGEVASTVDVDGHILSLNGAALYQATVFKVDIFTVSLYLEKTTHVAAEASACDGPLQLDFHWLHGASRASIANPWRASMTTNAGADLATFKPRIERLVDALPGVDKGDRWSFTYTPAAGTELRINGRPALAIPGRDFCQLFLAGDVGERAEENTRTGLLALSR